MDSGLYTLDNHSHQMKMIDVTLLVLRCSDIEESRAFYETLGLSFVAEKHGSGREHYSTRVGSLVVELYPQTDAETRGLRIGFSVADLATTLERFQCNGSVPIRVAWDAVPPNALIRDPDGHWIELTQMTQTIEKA